MEKNGIEDFLIGLFIMIIVGVGGIFMWTGVPPISFFLGVFISLFILTVGGYLDKKPKKRMSFLIFIGDIF